MALMPRDLRDGTGGWFPHRVPLAHVVDTEVAPGEVAEMIHGGQRFATGSATQVVSKERTQTNW